MKRSEAITSTVKDLEDVDRLLKRVKGRAVTNDQFDVAIGIDQTQRRLAVAVDALRRDAEALKEAD